MLAVRLLGLLLLLLHPLGGLEFWDDLPNALLADKLANSMTDQELLGQVFLLGYSGTYPSNAVLDLIRVRKTGGIKIFGWNVESTASLKTAIARMQEESQQERFKVPLLIATDQEGGWVRHIRPGTSDTPGSLALGATGLPRDAFLTGYYIGMELKSLGINMNLAPTVDLYTDPDANIIGPRTFGDDPILTGVLATAFYRGLESVGVIATAKHFPGHGDTRVDSHISLPTIQLSMETLSTRELIPYELLIAEGIPAIMGGHLAYPEIIGALTPVTLSRKMLTDILRGEMGYQGLIVTDDLIMTAIQQLPQETSLLTKDALVAGNDLVMISRSPPLQERIYENLSKEMGRDSSFRSRIRDAATRVLKLKLDYLKREEPVPLYPADRIGEPTPKEEESSRFFADHSYRSVTLLRGSLPVLDADGSDSILLIGQYGNFFEAGRELLSNPGVHDYSYYPFYEASRSELVRIKRKIVSYDKVVFCLANPNSLQILSSLEQFKEKLIVLSVLTPTHLEKVPWVDSGVCVYGTSTESFRAGFDALLGNFTPTGRLPIKLTPNAKE